jgi:hypothetical protein
LQDLDPVDDATDILRIEGQCLLQLVEDADEVEDEPGRFTPSVLILIGTVDPCNGLE